AGGGRRPRRTDPAPRKQGEFAWRGRRRQEEVVLRARRPGIFLIALFIALSGLTPAHGSKKTAPPPAAPTKPTLTLQASTRNGFLPLSVTLYGRLEGVARSETQF